MQIIAHQLSKSYNGIEYIIKNFSYTFEHNVTYCITGNNGSGKSTLLRMLAGLSNPSSGSVTVENGNQQSFGFVAPYMNIYEDMTVEEHCDFHFSTKSQQKISDDEMVQFEVKTLMHKQIRELSSGQKQRVKLFLAASTNPDILFLDEPSTNLDIRGFKIIEYIVAKYKKNGKILIIASNLQTEIDLTNEQISLT